VEKRVRSQKARILGTFGTHLENEFEEGERGPEGTGQKIGQGGIKRKERRSSLERGTNACQEARIHPTKTRPRKGGKATGGRI